MSYATFFKTDLGTIGVDIDGCGYGKGKVRISYEDAINAQLNENSKKANAIQDL